MERRDERNWNQNGKLTGAYRAAGAEGSERRLAGLARAHAARETRSRFHLTFTTRCVSRPAADTAPPLLGGGSFPSPR